MTVLCGHCGEVAPTPPFLAPGAEGERPACCPGCAAAMALIHDLGLDDYYRLRGADNDASSESMVRLRSKKPFI